jgi:hypothetical protein
MSASFLTLHYDGRIGHDRRETERFPVSIKGWMNTACDFQFEISVKNLSVDGFLIESSNSLEIGATILLRCPGVLFRDARVIWNRGDDYGCAFIIQSS